MSGIFYFNLRANKTIILKIKQRERKLEASSCWVPLIKLGLVAPFVGSGEGEGEGGGVSYWLCCLIGFHPPHLAAPLYSVPHLCTEKQSHCYCILTQLCPLTQSACDVSYIVAHHHQDLCITSLPNKKQKIKSIVKNWIHAVRKIQFIYHVI